MGGGEKPQDLVPIDPAAPVMSFFNLDGAALAITQSRFTQQDLVSKLIEMATDLDPKISLPAIKEFNRMMEKIATHNGRISKATHKMESRNDDGTRTTQSLSTSTLRTRLQSPPPPPQTQGREFRPPQLPPAGPSPDHPS